MDRLIAEVKELMSAAELADIKIENVTDDAKPLLYKFHVRVPGYAQRTGKRIFIQPAFFQRGPIRCSRRPAANIRSTSIFRGPKTIT